MFVCLLVLLVFSKGEPAVERWEVPEIGAENLAEWQTFIFPKGKEQDWRKVRWHRELEFAAEEAKELGRPVLLWTMNGHPSGET